MGAAYLEGVTLEKVRDVVLNYHDYKTFFKQEAMDSKEIKRDGELRGVCFFIRLYVDEARVVDTWASPTAWSTPYVRLKAPTPVRKGDVVEVSIKSDLSGNPSYSLQLMHKVDGGAKEIGRYAWSGD